MASNGKVPDPERGSLSPEERDAFKRRAAELGQRLDEVHARKAPPPGDPKARGAAMGAAFAKGLTFKMGQTHVHKYLKPLMARIEKGEIDPTFVISHRYKLADAARAYKEFATQQDECIKVVLKP